MKYDVDGIISRLNTVQKIINESINRSLTIMKIDIEEKIAEHDEMQNMKCEHMLNWKQRIEKQDQRNILKYNG